MSTEHRGGYCPVKDKMMLTQSKAVSMARNQRGMSPYKCEHCDHWHIGTSRKDGAKNWRMRLTSPRRGHRMR